MSRDLTAVYPGSFDPLTLGHLDIIRRGSRLFSKLIVAVAVNPSKRPLLPHSDRIGMLATAVADLPHVEVDGFEGLLVNYAAGRSASVVIRGIRSAGDFENEARMARMNAHLSGDLETVFLASSPHLSFISSSLVREIAGLRGSLKGLVPQHVDQILRELFANDK